MHIFCYKMLYNGETKIEKSGCFRVHQPVQVHRETCILEGFAQNFGYLEKLMLRLFQKAAGNLMDDAFYLYLSLVFS